MKQHITLAMALSAATMLTGVARAAELKETGTIAIPGEKLVGYDISYIDPATGLYYFADRSNKGIDIIDTKTNKFVKRVGSFAGVVMKDGKPNNDVSGPDGVLFAGKEIWAGDGDSTLKIIDPATGKVTATINTGGTTRVDEMAYDPKDEVFIGRQQRRRSAFRDPDLRQVRSQGHRQGGDRGRRRRRRAAGL